jgi:hypothetical protein
MRRCARKKIMVLLQQFQRNGRRFGVEEVWYFYFPIIRII